MINKELEIMKTKNLLFNIEEEIKSTEFYQSNDKKRGFILACTNKSYDDCLKNLIFCSNKVYGYKVMSVRKGDFLFLYNLDTDILYGVFEAITDGYYEKNSPFLNGKYPYMVKVQPINEIYKLEKASKVLKHYNLKWKDILTLKGVNLLSEALKGRLISLKETDNLIDINYRPPIFTTTFWDYPTQSYGDTQKGDNKYPGVTPAFIIYNLIYRYTEPGDLVLDPMAGSGTTIDVCIEEKRRVIAFDVSPTRIDIKEGDARNLPIPDESVDMIFIDSPYGDNIRYNDSPNNIGNISATDEKFYDELEKVMKECYRVLKNEKYLGWLIGDQWAKGIFIPVGFKIYERLTKYFKPVDIVCIARRNQSSNTPFWHNKAIQHNFYLRGFKYLIIVKKTNTIISNVNKINIKWSFYERKGRKKE